MSTPTTDRAAARSHRRNVVAENPKPMPKDEDDLAIPAFLIRKDAKRLTHEEAANLASPRQRDWAPIKSKEECTKRLSLNQIMAKVEGEQANPDLPVSVQAVVKGKQGSEVVAKYDNWKAYESAHDPKAYPVKRVAEVDGVTVVLVTAKPWAGTVTTANGTKLPRKAADMLGVFHDGATAPPTKAQRGPQAKKGDQWADSILAACAQPATRSQVIAFLRTAYPSTDPKDFDNVMYGTLERMVSAGKLTKEKVPQQGVFYRVVR